MVEEATEGWKRPRVEEVGRGLDWGTTSCRAESVLLASQVMRQYLGT